MRRKPRYVCPHCEIAFYELFNERCPVCLAVYRVPDNAPPQTKQSARSKRFHALVERDGRQCARCGSGKRLTIDHILPRSKGGTDCMGNLQLLCTPCNTEKADMMPYEWERLIA